MILKMRLDKERHIAYIDDSNNRLGGYDMWIIMINGTTFFPRSGTEAVEIFNSVFGRGVTIRYEKERSKKIA
jgi:hypothetical protein